MSQAKLEIFDALGRRVVSIEKYPFSIGRRDTNDLRLAGGEVSRDHAEIVQDDGRLVIRDKGSRYGTFVNGDAVSEQGLSHGDRVRLGRGGGAEMVVSLGASSTSGAEPAATTAIGDLRHVAALLEGLRALGSGRVLEDVLALVMDSAIEVSGAERGFVMLAGAGGVLEFKLSRARGRITLPGSHFETSRKIPEQVFDTGEARIVADLLDGDLANVHTGTVALGIRNVLCVPLKLVRYVEREVRREAAGAERRIGVLYLDSREKGSLLSDSTRAALETLATEAAVAIENARLYRETLEKAKMEQEMRIAAEIQRSLLPRATNSGPFFDAVASTVPCRSIGGDFYDCIDLPGGRFGFALGDVAGKGPPAALLSALVQGVFAAQGEQEMSPALTVMRVNQALIRRAIESRFVTMLYGVLDDTGCLTYCNAGHNAPFVVGPARTRRLETGGPPVGLFDGMAYEEETIVLEPGEWVAVFSDGVSEALSVSGDEFGEERIKAVVEAHQAAEPAELLEALLNGVREFTIGATQNDDVTTLLVRYRR